ncbi:hypothetical protein SteCoe_15654 [Stentor coeruleus]|uniref:Indoleamine 2,3-dioxygenase n=1 Tax=Stentor coeruleus TaxID=5963 RepID=A0A1R2C372_9CILI|nr:hypothetical protein SteCoe_15654 [Stentor coeruleus]
MENVALKYAKYHLSKTHGFCTEVPGLFDLKDLKPHISILKDLKNFDPSSISSLPMQQGIESLSYNELELSCLVHTTLNYLYYWHNLDKPNTVIPLNLAQPTMQISKLLDRPPMLTMVSSQLYNWDYIDPNKGFHPDNTKVVFSFTGTRDEDYFFTGANYIEYLGSPGINSIMELETAQNNPEEMKKHLENIAKCIFSLRSGLELVRKNIDPDVFYHKIRRGLKGFDKGVIFEGQEPVTMMLMGTTPTQTPLFKVFDAFLGICHDDEYLTQTELFMKKQHRELLRDIRNRDVKKMKENVKKFDLKDDWNRIIVELCEYRKIHTGVAVRNIIKPSGQSLEKGTGGSNIVQYLARITKTTMANMM